MMPFIFHTDGYCLCEDCSRTLWAEETSLLCGPWEMRSNLIKSLASLCRAHRESLLDGGALLDGGRSISQSAVANVRNP